VSVTDTGDAGDAAVVNLNKVGGGAACMDRLITVNVTYLLTYERTTAVEDGDSQHIRYSSPRRNAILSFVHAVLTGSRICRLPV